LSKDFEVILQNLALPAHPANLYDPIRYTLSMGGKRIRPKMVLAACGMCGGDITEATQAALAVETLHNFTLIHDDIMDNADKRRGFETVHLKWDLSTAILSGDALFAVSSDLLSYYGTNDAYSKTQYFELNKIFLDATRIVCEGQARDLAFENRTDVSLDEYLLMIEQKTAALLKAAMQMGGIVAGASAHQIDELGKLGLKAGLAFQIQDDLLDAIGNPETFGKKPGGDIAEGKKTYLSILAMQLADSADQKLLAEILESGTTSELDIAHVIDIYEKTGVIELTQKEIRRLYDEAFTSLSVFSENEFRNEINNLLNQLMIREN
jgi:geranylgeranyl diphosphate synthase, type II